MIKCHESCWCSENAHKMFESNYNERETVEQCLLLLLDILYEFECHNYYIFTLCEICVRANLFAMGQTMYLEANNSNQFQSIWHILLDIDVAKRRTSKQWNSFKSDVAFKFGFFISFNIRIFDWIENIVILLRQTPFGRCDKRQPHTHTHMKTYIHSKTWLIRLSADFRCFFVSTTKQQHRINIRAKFDRIQSDISFQSDRTGGLLSSATIES